MRLRPKAFVDRLLRRHRFAVARPVARRLRARPAGRRSPSPSRPVAVEAVRIERSRP